ncbi:uncharacterized protein TRIADDRAFT_53466 [Trichoplax adhaerens]|uniref:FHA domain-containing protein n=1 Tax=Trichoplax adhaerens TaxID=10228 RepID=B3RPA7_TRIAD|nr:hypothetical protein TRIADDRAFT_53466 [Trichoplax adhaerens]EDV27603.1 hypothetical protein TRIADDRAFT_53466 [Trichoplax adhaerens]|eukprot:XP_002109437.1 hypothetical protein TRIADDRAFT_53466 [Trichoplax adhaerens]
MAHQESNSTWSKDLANIQKDIAITVKELTREKELINYKYEESNTFKDRARQDLEDKNSNCYRYIITRPIFPYQAAYTSVGSLYSDCNIRLPGALISERHCYFEISGDKITVTPTENSATYVNGELLKEKKVLHNVGIKILNDKIVFGDQFFRVNCSRRRALILTQPTTVGSITFKHAYQELLSKQLEK